MMLHIRGLLTPDHVRHCRDILRDAKHNLQLPEDTPQAKALGEVILKALAGNAHFMSAALPLKVYPPLFNRYGEGMGFGDHIDNAIRISPVTGGRYRTDLSCTLFLSDPDDYDGGELLFEDGVSARPIKLPAGDMILYPATTVHRVEPITRGERWASFFWVQSMVADLGRRELLYRLDQAVAATRQDLGDGHAASVSLVGVYHNLVRMWAER